MEQNPFSDITPTIRHYSDLSLESATIDPNLYTKYDVKRGLRDLNGRGVLVGLTEISDVNATKIVDGKSVPAEGSLYYRGYNVFDIVRHQLDYNPYNIMSLLLVHFYHLLFW